MDVVLSPSETLYSHPADQGPDGLPSLQSLREASPCLVPH